MLSPCQPEMGTKAHWLILNPTFFMLAPTSFLISLNLDSLYGGSVLSILFTATIICFTCLSVFRDSSLKLTSTTGNDQDGTVGLRCARDHVLDEIPMSRCVDDGDVVLVCLELHELDIDGDTSFTFSFQLVQPPSILKGSLAHLLGFLLKLLDGSFVDASAFVDQVTS